MKLLFSTFIFLMSVLTITAGQQVATDDPEEVLDCAMQLFSRPDVPFIHKIKPYDASVTIVPDSLPNGLQWNKELNRVEGKISKAGLYSYKLLLINDVDTVIETISLTVSDSLQQPVPFMGWLSWNVVEGEISESVVKEIADAMVETGLRDAGYRYLVIDDLWHSQQRDSITGAPLPDPIKFPNGMREVADYVHSKGLKLGIYSDAGSKTCAGCYGSYGFEEIDASTYASWGVDLLKYDYCNVDEIDLDKAGAYKRYKAMGDALKESGRVILFYMCEWGVREPWKWGAETGATTWRCTYDSRDGWNGKEGGIGITQSVEGMKNLWPYSGVNRFNDADMMCVGIHGKGKSSSDLVDGKPGMTQTEYQTQFAMWCMWASPLTLSFDLRNPIAPEDLNIITNRDLIAVNQDPLGQQAELILETPDHIQLYVKELIDGDIALALLNMSNNDQAYHLVFDDIKNLEGVNEFYVRDLQEQNDLGKYKTSMDIDVVSHATCVYKLSKAQK